MYLKLDYILTDKCINGDIKLSGSGYSSVGMINVCVNGVWGTICNTGFDDADASVACAQLGFSRYGNYCFTCALSTFLTGRCFAYS